MRSRGEESSTGDALKMKKVDPNAVNMLFTFYSLVDFTQVFFYSHCYLLFKLIVLTSGIALVDFLFAVIDKNYTGYGKLGTDATNQLKKLKIDKRYVLRQNLMVYFISPPPPPFPPPFNQLELNVSLGSKTSLM